MPDIVFFPNIETFHKKLARAALEEVCCRVIFFQTGTRNRICGDSRTLSRTVKVTTETKDKSVDENIRERDCGVAQSGVIVVQRDLPLCISSE